MRIMGTIELHGKWTTAGDLYLFAIDEEGQRVEVQQLIRHLFAWDSRSFYGTFVETVEWQDRKFVLLKPLAAARFLQAPHPVLHAALTWSEELLALQQAARLCIDALTEGWFVPCFEHWKAGKLGWRIEIPDRVVSDAQLAMANEWFQDVMSDLLRQDSGAATAFEELRREHFHAIGDSIDEDEWLIAIGWKRDEIPFRAGVEIQEPRDGQAHWRLQMLLQDRERPDVMIETDAMGRPRSGSLPDGWQPFVEARLDQARFKLAKVVSWLDMNEMQESGQWELSDEQAWKFLSEDSLALLQAGGTVWLPAWWDELRSRRPRIKAKVKSNTGTAGPARLGLQQLVEFDWKLALGDVELS